MRRPKRTWPCRIVTVATAGAMAAPGVALGWRGPDAEPAADTEASGTARAPDPAVAEAVAEAERLYRRGEAAFATAEYEEAVALWTEAFSRVPDAPQAGRIKVLLIYNIATAREQAFAVDRDVQQLRKAKILLESFAQSIPALYEGEQLETESARVAERIAGIEARIAQAEEEDAEPVVPAPAPVPSPPPEPVPADSASSDAGRGLIIGGAVCLGLGVAGLGLMGAGLGMGARANDLDDLDDTDVEGRRDQFDRGRTGNALAIAGGISGGVLTALGAVLVGVGVARKRKGNVALGPGPGTVGVAMRARF